MGKLQLKGTAWEVLPPQLPPAAPGQSWGSCAVRGGPARAQAHVCPWEGLSPLAPWAGTADRAEPDRVKGTQCSRDTLGLVQAKPEGKQTPNRGRLVSPAFFSNVFQPEFQILLFSSSWGGQRCRKGLGGFHTQC